MRFFHDLAADRRGNVSMIVAGALTVMIATTALAVDAGTLYLEKRKLQGIADAAALAAANDPGSAKEGAQSALALNDAADVRLDALATGSYTSDPARSADARFDPSGASKEAVRLTLKREIPSFFGQFLNGKRGTSITARSTAARMNFAAFSLGSRLASVQGGLPNALLSGLAGTNLSLTVMDYNALASAQVDVLKFSESLRTTARLNVSSFGEVLSSQVTLPQILQAMAAATNDAAAAATFRRLAGVLPPTRMAPSLIIDLGPLSTNVRADPADPVNVDGYSFLKAMLEVGGTNHYVDLSLGVAVPGLTSTRLMIVIGDRPRNSPWLSIGAQGAVTVRTTQTRLYLDSTVSALGIGTVRIPVFVELAPAQATLGEVTCAGGRSHASATLNVTPSVGRVAIADFDASSFDQLGTAPVLKPAKILQLPLVSATGFADILLGGVSAQQVSFSQSDIADQRIKTVSTNDLVQGVVGSLLQRLSINVANTGSIGLPLVSGPAVSGVLTQAAAPVDQLLSQIMGLAGVRIGEADARVNGVRCGTPMLVG